MKKVNGLLSIGGFMVTMFCYVVAGIEVTKLELIITFLTWIGIEIFIYVIRRLVQILVQHEKRTGETPVQFHS